MISGLFSCHVFLVLMFFIVVTSLGFKIFMPNAHSSNNTIFIQINIGKKKHLTLMCVLFVLVLATMQVESFIIIIIISSSSSSSSSSRCTKSSP